jgi:hypothetical protein
MEESIEKRTEQNTSPGSAGLRPPDWHRPPSPFGRPRWGGALGGAGGLDARLPALRLRFTPPCGGLQRRFAARGVAAQSAATPFCRCCAPPRYSPPVGGVPKTGWPRFARRPGLAPPTKKIGRWGALFRLGAKIFWRLPPALRLRFGWLGWTPRPRLSPAPPFLALPNQCLSYEVTPCYDVTA